MAVSTRVRASAGLAALARSYKVEVKHQDDLTQFLDTNPFHASIQISLKDPAQYNVIQERLTREPIVSGVENIQNLVERVLTVTNFL